MFSVLFFGCLKFSILLKTKRHYNKYRERSLFSHREQNPKVTTYEIYRFENKRIDDTK